jgi:hypothetical protein
MFCAGALLLFTVGLCLAENGEAKDETYTVTLAFDKGKPVVGANRVIINVTDSGSRPIAGAQVNVNYFMPSLPGRPPMMGSSVKATPSKGAYETVLKLSMKGEWRIIVSIATLAKNEEVAFGYVVE